MLEYSSSITDLKAKKIAAILLDIKKHDVKFVFDEASVGL
jgi:hypothetical protein